MHHSLHLEAWSQLGTLARVLRTRRHPKQKSQQKLIEINVMTWRDHLLKFPEDGNRQRLQIITPWQQKNHTPSFNLGRMRTFPNTAQDT